MEDAHKSAIQNAIIQIRGIEESVERMLAKGQQPSAAKMNSIISDELDRLSEVLGTLRSNENGQ